MSYWKSHAYLGFHELEMLILRYVYIHMNSVSSILSQETNQISSSGKRMYSSEYQFLKNGTILFQFLFH